MREMKNNKIDGLVREVIWLSKEGVGSINYDLFKTLLFNLNDEIEALKERVLNLEKVNK